MNENEHNEEIVEYPDEVYQIIADAKKQFNLSAKRLFNNEKQFEMITDLFGDGNASLLDIKELLNDQASMYEDWNLELVEKNNQLQLHAILKNDVENKNTSPSRYINWIKINNRCYYVVIGNLVE